MAKEKLLISRAFMLDLAILFVAAIIGARKVRDKKGVDVAFFRR
jgi:hypothetical protein